MEQQIYLLRQDLDDARNLLAAKEKRQLEEATDKERIGQNSQGDFGLSSHPQGEKISRRAFFLF